MDSNVELVEFLKRVGVLGNRSIAEAFETVDRGNFVHQTPYDDVALPVLENVTISQPSLIARMLELLDVKNSQRVLDVGSGSGYTACLLSKIVGVNGTVLSIDVNAQAVSLAEKNARKAKCSNVEFAIADALTFPFPKKFDCILVSVACRKIPENLTFALDSDGRLVLPLGDGVVQEIVVLKKQNEKIQTISTGMQVSFLRMRDAKR